MAGKDRQDSGRNRVIPIAVLRCFDEKPGIAPGFFIAEMRTVRITQKSLQNQAETCIFGLAFCASAFIVLGNSNPL
jgi:hypothetical protein